MGRISRKGNENKNVTIFRYVTKDTFDSYNWTLIENKQRFIGQVMTSKNPARSAEDIDDMTLSYAEIKSLTTGDERIKEKMDLDVQVKKLKVLKSNHASQIYYLQDKITIQYPEMIKNQEQKIAQLQQAIAIIKQEDTFFMTLQGQNFMEKKEAGEKILSICKTMPNTAQLLPIGNYRGLDMKLGFQNKHFEIILEQVNHYEIELGEDVFGNITRINNAIENIPHMLEKQQEKLIRLQAELEKAKTEVEKPFPQEQELKQKSERLLQLNIELDMEQNKKQGNTEKIENEAEKNQDNLVSLESKKTSILSALQNFKSKENAVEVKKQKEVVL